ncbi:MAG: hypothetical protein C4K60_02290 [Ideonella sp. MAG2]|nr:MAG: hypothetical protein C4K60_02290 [Ideonella sp. MAG2]
MALAAGLALMSSGLAKAAGPVRSTAAAGVMGQASKAVSQSPYVVLYDQNDNDAGSGFTSQNFEADFDAFDNQAADDFVVPAGVKWTVKELVVTGAYFNGTGLMPSVNVTFYKSKGGKPGAVKADFPAVVPVDNGTGSLVITLPAKLSLKPGSYWVSVQANMDFSAGGQWAWQGRSVQANNPAQWQNPGDGFGSGCTTYGDMSTCLGVSVPDFMFSLNGVSKPL